MVKAKKSSTIPEELSKDCTWLSYLKEDSMRFFPSKNDWRKRLIYSMYAFLDEVDKKGREPIDILQFCKKYKIPYRTLIHWTKQYEDIASAYEDFKLFLASHRRIGAAYKELDKDVIFKNQHHYDPEWDGVNKYNAALKTEEPAHGPQYIFMKEMPSSDKVKDKQ